MPGKKILLVEDDIIIASAEKKSLEKYGYSVITANTGETAVSAVDDMPDIDLILMDIDLGHGIDGTVAAEQILKKKEIPVVFLSSHSEPEIVEKTEKITSYGYILKNSGIIVLDASIKMAFKLFNAHNIISKELEERKKAEEEIRIITERMQLSQAAAGSGVWDWHINSGRIDWTSEMYTLFGLPAEYNSASFDIWRRILHPEDLDCAENKIMTALNARKKLFNEYRIIRPDGETRWIHARGQGIYDENGKPLRMIGICIDITEKKQAEEALRISEEKFAKTFRAAPDAFIISRQRDGLIKDVNDNWEKIFKYPREEVIGKTILELGVYDDPAKRQQGIELLKTQGFLKNFEIDIHTKHGELRNVILFIEPIELDGEPYMITVAHDITNVRITNNKLMQQLTEKEILLKEVHHRIKNNITYIEGFLVMQSETIANQEAKEALQASISRVNTMRILYDKLLIDKDYKDVPVKQYCESLIMSIAAMFPGSERITIENRITDFTLNTKQTVAIGIIINELLTNIFKYAFREQQSGLITVSIEKSGEHVTLTISDDGVGIDSSIDLSKPASFGLTIVRMLTEQLQGSFTIKNGIGTKSTIEFEL